MSRRFRNVQVEGGIWPRRIDSASAARTAPPALAALDAKAVAKASYGGSANDTVSLDLTFGIDPTFANAGEHSLVFSEGIAAVPVPEPTTWGKLGVGLALLVASTRRARG